jgi:hypothetical protein
MNLGLLFEQKFMLSFVGVALSEIAAQVAAFVEARISRREAFGFDRHGKLTDTALFSSLARLRQGWRMRVVR